MRPDWHRDPCPAGGTDGFYRGRPRWPADATPEQIVTWLYAEGECDVCLAWVPLEDGPALVGTRQVLAPHAKGAKP